MVFLNKSNLKRKEKNTEGIYNRTLKLDCRLKPMYINQKKIDSLILQRLIILNNLIIFRWMKKERTWRGKQ